MNIATTLRYVDMKHNSVWDHRYYIAEGYLSMAATHGIGLVGILSDSNIEEICATCDGLIVPGSATNIDPKYYGMPPLDEPIPVDEYALDAKLMDYFISHGKPVFGICGGHQALNIFLGGTIKKMDDPVNHCDHTTSSHPIDIVKDTFVYDVFQSETANVNCYHAWEIDKLAPCLKVAARTRDGVIEAVECKEKFLFGTQWHPDLHYHFGDPVEQNFFVNFLKCCEECRNK